MGILEDIFGGGPRDENVEEALRQQREEDERLRREREAEAYADWVRQNQDAERARQDEEYRRNQNS